MVEGKFVLPAKYAEAIGRIADTWAHLEFQIDLGIWELANVEQQLGACITSQFNSVIPRLRAFIALCELRGAKKKSVDSLKTYSGNIGGFIDKRNRAVHDPRMIEQTTGEVVRLEIIAKPKITFEFLPEEISGLEKNL